MDKIELDQPLQGDMKVPRPVEYVEAWIIVKDICVWPLDFLPAENCTYIADVADHEFEETYILAEVPKELLGTKMLIDGIEVIIPSEEEQKIITIRVRTLVRDC